MIVVESIAALHRSLGVPSGYAAARGLPAQAEAAENDLVMIGTTPTGRNLRLTVAAAAAWDQMRLTAAGEGISLVPISGFRSVARQAEIVREKLAAGQTIAAILGINAAPGYSEHHTGRALDIGTAGQPPLVEAFADTAAYVWLTSHASNYGFILSYPRNNPWGLAFEPWHWLYQA